MAQSGLCRLCAEAKNSLVGIYDNEGQKLMIEFKIAKCLQIQVLITDGLPLTVCVDCCDVLNKCNEFIEKTNQAQILLRELLVNSKAKLRSVEPDVEYVAETVEFPRHEDRDQKETTDQKGCQLSDNYINETVKKCEEETKAKEKSVERKDKEERRNKEEPKEEKKSKEEKKLKEEKKKKSKENKSKEKKMQKMEETSKNQRHSSRLDKKQNDVAVKSNVTIVDTSESNLEVQKSQSAEKTPVEMKHSTKDKYYNLDKYSWLCTDCNETLPSLIGLVEHHANVHNQSPKYMCVQCSKVYDKYQGFVTHVKRHGKQDKEKYSCDECGKTYTQQKNLVDHMWIHTGERPYKCKSCDKSFRNSSSLFIHKRCHLPDNLKYQYQCDQCDKKFSTKPNLVTHKLIHTGVRNFTCDQCGKSFMQKGNLEAHFLTHTEEKPYKCSICPKAFKTPMQLKKHDLVHTDIKPHQCAVCGKTFREKSTLKEHSRIHSNAMPFTCEYCGKAFRFKGVLVTHKRQHTGERPYSCADCQHHFTNWPNYQKHMRRRHGINIAFTRFLPKDQLPIQLQQSMKQSPQMKEQPRNQANPDNPLPVAAVTQPEPTIQVIQTAPHAAPPQQTVARAIPTTTVPSFQTDVTSAVQETVFREQNTTYFTTVSVTPDNLLPTNLPYHFYTMSNVTGNI